MLNDDGPTVPALSISPLQQTALWVTSVAFECGQCGDNLSYRVIEAALCGGRALTPRIRIKLGGHCHPPTISALLNEAEG